MVRRTRLDHDREEDAVTIAVTTPTGNVGSHVVRMLCQAGVRPRLLLRDPNRLDDELREYVDVAVGDIRDADYVLESTRGLDAIYWVHPEDFTLLDFEADADRSGERLAAAVRANGIPRVVFQSTVGAEVRHGAGYLDAMARIEERLDAVQKATGTALLHLRCGYFMTNLLGELTGLRAGRLTTSRPLDEPMPWVDPRDIATVAALRLLAGDWEGQQIQAVHGPSDLTWPEAAAALSTATGLTIKAQPVTRDDERAGLRAAGLPEVAVEGMVGMSISQAKGFVPEQPRTPLTTTPTTLTSWAATTLRPLLTA
jgi:uncharacterized protein YbjT (DUF2867 family)